MDIKRFENAERAEETIKEQAELAEAKLRSIERSRTKSESIPDTDITDKAGNPITVRTWESGNQAFVRAYDTNKVSVPDRTDIGQAGYANATIEQNLDGQTRIRLNDIVTTPEYRNGGISGTMLSKVEQYARKNNAYEIYGSIDSQDAQKYLQHQADKGWVIDYSKGAYGELHKKLQ